MIILLADLLPDVKEKNDEEIHIIIKHNFTTGTKSYQV